MKKQKYFMMYFACGWKKVYTENEEPPINDIVCFTETDGTLLIIDGSPFPFYESIENCKLVLRKIEDMTEEEKVQGFDYIDSVIYLLAKGIDLFELIEKGYAVNEKEL